jgi:hypothetical protein
MDLVIVQDDTDYVYFSPMSDHHTNQGIPQKNWKKYDLIAWSAYGALWLTALILPNYSIFQFTGEESIDEFHYRGFENLFDQVALLLIALSATLFSLGRPMVWKRVLLIVVPIGLAILYLSTFMFRSAATGFSQNFHYGYFITQLSTVLAWVYSIYRQFRSSINPSDDRKGNFYSLALTFSVISLLINVLNNPWFGMMPNILATLLPIPFWLAEKKRTERPFGPPEILIILVIGVLIALFNYIETEESLKEISESVGRQLRNL